MTAKASSAKTTPDAIISHYMTHVLEQGESPVSVYKFCKEHQIKEEEFYNHFGSFQGLEKAIWNTFFSKTDALLRKNKEYNAYDKREKLLTFYYTFFEMLSLNRSYVLLALDGKKERLKTMKQLSGLRVHIREFGKMLVEESNSEKRYQISRLSPGFVAEGVWVQFLFLLKFWMDDNSPGFERTDVAIEKSVNTVFELFDNAPFDSIIDFGKFLYGERMS
ncbi:TetR family transcriptional regulator C-terminal domain-containing protein [Zeaxanthinibacter sp. PT1]|uniref:TetR/AcrR family transcriptional regulator n=1 Tax=Zeaxanthinibacter TaxID=561554 RepID=UPI00234B8DC4|nr:TetR family transcriptional regulator C-terminal domain-containing protein [Zeaxanthinibacter sp. PT1]MDC6351888.1 TetR family transcriptional regulator C-terminal domain-containing protein [Zeaxanthinibacter sp. PT1]